MTAYFDFFVENISVYLTFTSRIMPIGKSAGDSFHKFSVIVPVLI